MLWLMAIYKWQLPSRKECTEQDLFQVQWTWGFTSLLSKNLRIDVLRIFSLCFVVISKLGFILDYDLSVSQSSNMTPSAAGQHTQSRMLYTLLRWANTFSESGVYIQHVIEDKTRNKWGINGFPHYYNASILLKYIYL